MSCLYNDSKSSNIRRADRHLWNTNTSIQHGRTLNRQFAPLDKHRFPFLNLCGTREWSDDDYMTVMGGAGAYWLSVTSGEHDQRRLFDVDRGNADVLLWTSDQGFSQPECFTTDRLEDVLLAANTFYECGDCAADLIWE